MAKMLQFKILLKLPAELFYLQIRSVPMFSKNRKEGSEMYKNYKESGQKIACLITLTIFWKTINSKEANSIMVLYSIGLKQQQEKEK